MARGKEKYDMKDARQKRIIVSGSFLMALCSIVVVMKVVGSSLP